MWNRLENRRRRPVARLGVTVVLLILGLALQATVVPVPGALVAVIALAYLIYLVYGGGSDI
jgi:hypothetical protein